MTPPVIRYAFADAALDRAAELRDAAELRARFEQGDARVLVLRADWRVPVVIEPPALLPATPADTGLAFEQLSFLAMRDGVPWFAATLATDAATALWPRAKFLDLRSAGALLGADEAGLAAYARALLHWRSRKRYCGRCGAATRFEAAGHRARCSDGNCGQEYFPRTDPAIIVVVSDGERCLLGRQESWPAKRYSTLAGFVEPGETLEQAVAREVREESGVRVASSRYVSSQPWPFPAALMLGFEAEAASREIRLGDELSDARWFSAEELAQQSASGELILPPALSISFHLVNRWYHARTGRELPDGPNWTGR